jgi:hypothetical protein
MLTPLAVLAALLIAFLASSGEPGTHSPVEHSLQQFIR